MCMLPYHVSTFETRSKWPLHVEFDLWNPYLHNPYLVTRQLQGTTTSFADFTYTPAGKDAQTLDYIVSAHEREVE